jgi:hypothetical protein
MRGQAHRTGGARPFWIAVGLLLFFYVFILAGWSIIDYSVHQYIYPGLESAG